MDDWDESIDRLADGSARISRAKLLAGGVAGLGGLSLAGQLAEAASAAAPFQRGPRRTIIWAVSEAAAWQAPIDVGFHDAAALIGWKYQKVVGQGSSPENQVNVIRRATLAKPDVLASNYWYKPQMSAFADAQKAGIFTMAIEADGWPADRNKLGMSYVGVDNYLSGFTLGQRLASELVKKGKKTGTFVYGVPFPGSTNLEVQGKGISDAIDKANKKNGTSFRVENFPDKADSNIAQSSGLYRAKVKQLGSKFVGATSGSDNFPSIIIDVLKSTGKKPGDYVLGAFRSQPATLKAIRDGWVAASSDQSYYPPGFMSTLYAWLWLDRRMPPLDYETGGGLIDKSNLGEIQKREARINDLAKKYGIKVS
ncbi:MAG: ribose transport system substrate-binding protein [Gaiellaceae bacterium]|jgi:ABC-type sugar transport system substrate-binding protein|nr:ribose transport system substrate-binding protein [Gaiellaceae bacterium]